MNTISNIPYISDAFYEQEKRIWRTAWLVAARASDELTCNFNAKDWRVKKSFYDYVCN